MVALRMLPRDTRHICLALNLNFGFREYGIVKKLCLMLYATRCPMYRKEKKVKSCVIVCLGVKNASGVLILKALFRLYISELCSCLPR